jgi:hypothetical protein
MTATPVKPPAAPAPPRPSPYQGLRPYTEEDAQFFFGRDAWQEVIIDNLLAHSLTLLYGESGVGKSSVLRAGVVPELRRRHSSDDLSPLAVTVFDAWRDPLGGLASSVEAVVEQAFGRHTVQIESAGDARDRLAALADRVTGRLIVILDQFEEYFVYHGHEPGAEEFAAQLALAVGEQRRRVHYLISIREDSLAKLDRFKDVIPELFDNLLRIEPLDRATAEDAIVQPVERYNEVFGVGIAIDPDLPGAVIDQVDAVGGGFHYSGRGVTPWDSDEQRIQAPYLQLVMERLWRQEIDEGSTRLRTVTLESLGGASAIVRHHLDEAMRTLPPAQRFLAARAFHYLVTPSGAKFAHTAGDLAQYTGVDVREVETVLERLGAPDVRILRRVSPPPRRGGSRDDAPRYEIHHDALGPAVLDWRVRELRNERKSLVKAFVTAGVINTLCLGAPVGALVLVPFLRRAKPPYEWREVARIAAGWIAGAVAGLIVGLVLGAIAGAVLGATGEEEETLLGLLAFVGLDAGGIAGGVLASRRAVARRETGPDA